MHTTSNSLREENHAMWYLSIFTILLHYEFNKCTLLRGEETGKGKKHLEQNLQCCINFFSYDEPKDLYTLDSPRLLLQWRYLGKVKRGMDAD